jgi:TonB family protein
MKTNVQLILVTVLAMGLSIGTVQAQMGPDKDGIYNVAENVATYKGGQQAMFEYLFKNIKYPENAIKNKIEGIVYVKFVIRKDGSIDKAEVLKGVKELNDEALRVIKTMPNWQAGTVKNNAVDSYMTLPISFKLG